MTELTTVRIPPAARRSDKTWRKTLRGIDPTQPKGYAATGQFLDPAESYELPVGGLILGYDRIRSEHVLTVWQITEGGLAEIKKITRKGTTWAGPATLTALGKLVAKHPWINVFRNRFQAQCDTCWRTVPAREGLYVAGTVTHKPGACPANGHTGPVWTIEAHQRGSKKSRPSLCWEDGAVVRAEDPQGELPIPADAPGGKPNCWGRVSAIVVVVGQAEPVFLHQTSGYDPDAGWYFRARVRLTTPDEAEPLLAAEEEQATRERLMRGGRKLTVRPWDVDGIERPDTVDPDYVLGLPGARPEPASPIPGTFMGSHGVRTHLRLDEPGGWLLICRNAVAEPTSANCGNFAVWRLPLTPDLVELVGELRQMFGEV